MEAHAMKLPAHTFWADVNVRRGLEACNYWIPKVLSKMPASDLRGLNKLLVTESS